MAKFLSVLAILIAGAFLSVSSASAMSDLTVGTGSLDLNYNKAGNYFKDELRDIVKITPEVTKGSIDNLEGLNSKKFTGAFTQMDALVSVRRISPSVTVRPKVVMALYDEYVHFLCNTKKYTESRVTGMLDTNNFVIAVDSPKSGSNATWQAMVQIEPRYQNVPTTNKGGEEALEEVIQGNVACMVFVAGLNSDLVKSANLAAKDGAPIKLLNFNDKDFFKSERAKYDGVSVYSEGELPKRGDYYYITGSGRPDTLKVSAAFVVHPDWYDANQAEYGVLLRNIRQKIAGLKTKLKLVEQ